MAKPPFQPAWQTRAWPVFLALCCIIPLLPVTPALLVGPADAGPPSRLAAAISGAATPPVGGNPTAEGAELLRQHIVRDDMAIQFSLTQVQSPPRPTAQPQEGDDVIFRFTVTDATTGAPLRSVYPAAWMGMRSAGEIADTRTCLKKAATFIEGSLFAAADLDLTIYYVLTLNHDATLTVVDPRFGFGGTKLLALIPLRSPGEDWALTADQARLFVSMPAAQQVAVVDTASWQVLTNVDIGPHPTRLALQPDEHYLWVTYGPAEGGPADSGVAVLTTAGLKVVAHIPTGAGPHDIAFSADNRFAFITNAAAGTVSIIDVRQLAKLKELSTGRQPTSIALSPLANAVTVVHAGDGSIVVVDAERHEIVARLQAEPGLGPIKFAPGGRLGFVVHPEKKVVHILDAATNRLVQTGDVEEGPDQIAFSDKLAYVHHRDTATVLMIPLDGVGIDGQPVPVASFPAGQNPPGQASRPSPAHSIVQAPGANAVLVANPADQAVYFYKEGLPAPMGHFRNYSREPRAVLVVDRSLRERSPGVYETAARLPRPGLYDVVFFVNTPRVVHCFEVAVLANPALAPTRPTSQVHITPLLETRTVPVGSVVRLPFKLTDPSTQSPKMDVQDVNVLVYLAPGIWHKRQWAMHVGEGTYTIDFVPPQVGTYYVYLESRSLGLAFNNPQYLIFQATPGKNPSTD
jgi:DNA-binding beta-propeller fold protein YncE